MSEQVFSSSGDLGDIIAMCAVIRHMGGGKLLLINRPYTKPMTGERFDYIAPLLRLQPYLTSVEKHEGDLPEGCIDFSQFRSKWGNGRTLIDKHAAYAGIKPEEIDINTPWITVPRGEAHGKIVVVRTARYSGHLAYHNLLQYRAKDCLFLGLREEFEAFCWNCARNPGKSDPSREAVYRPTRDAIEAAQVILGARRVVANPTFMLWLAIALGHSAILVDCAQEDSRIERAGIRNVVSCDQNPLRGEWACL